jgi:hypothetical protein
MVGQYSGYTSSRRFTWEEFKKKFREANVLESIMELKRREFENLEQKDKSIMRYVKEFTLLSRYASEDVNTDEKRMKQFMRGLHPMAKMQLRMLKASYFQELVDASITMEDDFKQVIEDGRKKAKIEPRRYSDTKPIPNLKFKSKFGSGGNVTPRGNSSGAGGIVFRSCGIRGHLEKDYWKPKIICFGCKKEGHMIRNCPDKARTGGRGTGCGSHRGGGFGGGSNKRPSQSYGKLNCTNLEEVNQSDKTMIGTLQILSHPGKVLFNMGATTSFISQEFVDLYGIPCNRLEYPITVLSAGERS